MNNLSLVNIITWWHRLFYNINYMLNSKQLSLVNKIGDKTEFTITRVHCIWAVSFIHQFRVPTFTMWFLAQNLKFFQNQIPLGFTIHTERHQFYWDQRIMRIPTYYWELFWNMWRVNSFLYKHKSNSVDKAKEACIIDYWLWT